MPGPGYRGRRRRSGRDTRSALGAPDVEVRRIAGRRRRGQRRWCRRPRVLSVAAAEPPPDHPERVVVAVRDALLQRDDRVVRDLDVLGTDLRAALRDVAEADPGVVLEVSRAVGLIGGVHLEPGGADEEPGPEERALDLVVAEDVTDVLAEEALDALPE